MWTSNGLQRQETDAWSKLLLALAVEKHRDSITIQNASKTLALQIGEFDKPCTKLELETLSDL